MQVLATGAVRSGVIEEGERHHLADARSLVAAYRNTDGGERPMDEVAEVLETIGSRPGITG